MRNFIGPTLQLKKKPKVGAARTLRPAPPVLAPSAAAQRRQKHGTDTCEDHCEWFWNRWRGFAWVVCSWCRPMPPKRLSSRTCVTKVLQVISQPFVLIRSRSRPGPGLPTVYTCIVACRKVRRPRPDRDYKASNAREQGMLACAGTDGCSATLAELVIVTYPPNHRRHGFNQAC